MAENITGVVGALEGRMQWRFIAVRAAGMWAIRDLWIDTLRSIKGNERAEEYPVVGLTEAEARGWLAKVDAGEEDKYRRANPPDDCSCGCEGDIESHRR